MEKFNNQIIYSIDEIKDVAAELYKLFDKCLIFSFTGTLGAGKTTLIKNLLEHAGVTDIVVSPTFTYLIAYTNNKGQNFYHFDLYRLNSMQDFIVSGFDEYLYLPNSWSFIEWPEIIEPMIQKKVCKVHIDYFGIDKRIITYEVVS